MMPVVSDHADVLKGDDSGSQASLSPTGIDGVAASCVARQMRTMISLM